MSVYLLSIEPEGYKELTLPEGVSFLQSDCLRWVGNSKADTWKTPEFVWVNDDFSQVSDSDGDFIKFSGSFVISDKAFQILQPVLNDQAEFLPVLVDGKIRFILNILNVLDIINKEKSIYKIYSDGKIGACEHAFINEPGKNELIYKVQGFPGRTFANEVFAEIIQDSNLKGALIRQYINP